MKKDIYKDGLPAPENTPAQVILKKVNQLQKQINDIDAKKEVNVISFPAVQKVEITNPAEKPDPIEFPDIQKVEVTNPQRDVTFPDVQDVHVTNPPRPADLHTVERLLTQLALKDVVFPDVQRVKVTNPTPAFIFPTAKGNKGDPSFYVPVRLTTGERFYNALEDAFIAAGQKSFPFVNREGHPQAAQINDDGSIPFSASITTTSGIPLDMIVRNFPTVQTVAVQSMPAVSVTFPAITTISGQAGVTLAVSGVVTAVSGTQHAVIDNFPTIQSVNVVNLPAENRTWTLVSGTDNVNVANFPTVQTVNVANMPTVVTTAVSGTNHEVIDNFPTVQTVNVQNLPAVTAISGTQHVVMDNFPTVQTTFNTTTSGNQHTVIDNFPTVATVTVSNFPAVTTISGQAGVTLAVSGIVTAVSGTQHVVMDNFPTVQTVNVLNIPSVVTTAISGTNHEVIDNFPTIQTVNVQNLPNLTSISGANLHVFMDNEPTIQTVGGTIGANSPTGVPVPANAFFTAGLAKTALPAAATDGNLTGQLSDKFGREIIVPFAFRDIVGTQVTTISGSQAETTVVSALASTFNDIVAMKFNNTSSTTTLVDIRDATGGTIVDSIEVPANDIRGWVYSTPWPQTAVNNNWTIQCNTGVVQLRVSVLYIKNK